MDSHKKFIKRQKELFVDYLDAGFLCAIKVADMDKTLLSTNGYFGYTFPDDAVIRKFTSLSYTKELADVQTKNIIKQENMLERTPWLVQSGRKCVAQMFKTQTDRRVFYDVNLLKKFDKHATLYYDPTNSVTFVCEDNVIAGFVMPVKIDEEGGPEGV